MNRKTPSTMLVLFLAGGIPLRAAGNAASRKGGPSRAAEKGCAWEKLSDPAVGLEAWVQHCDFGFRKIDLRFSGNSLAIHYSDGGGIDPLVDVYGLNAGESVDAGIDRLFREKTEKALAARCVRAPYRSEFQKTPAGVERFTFVPDKAYEAELEAAGPPDGVPDPPCGDWGDAPDGIQYWEAQPGNGVRRVLFVRVGQDTPLYDEQTLRILSAK
jgi:hypothetical protein